MAFLIDRKLKFCYIREYALSSSDDLFDKKEQDGYQFVTLFLKLIFWFFPETEGEGLHVRLTV